MEGLGARRIYTELSRVIGDACDSPAPVEHWLVRFREGKRSCADRSRSGRPVSDISECLHAFLDKFLLASVNMMSKHFRTARGTIMEVLQRDLGLKSSPVDGCHISSAQLITKSDPINRSRALLYLLQQLQPFDFDE
jgi:hypothetical protein